jgi:radical SAM protein with 4Fe4S-binding SPASM domain
VNTHRRYYLASLGLSRRLKEFEYGYLRSGKWAPPSYVVWDATRRCNLSCLHCGASKETYARELTTEQVKDLVTRIARMGSRSFGVTGGEPLLREDLTEILSYADEQGLVTTLATNGFLLDMLKAKELKQAGLRSIQISLDGEEAIHNHIRNNSQSYARALESVKYCQEVQIPLITISSVVSRFNYASLPFLKQILLDNKIKHWKLIPLMPIGRAAKDMAKEDKSLLKGLFDFIIANKRQINIILGENLPYLGKYDRLVRDKPTYCPVGIGTLCLGVDGNVRGCPEMPDTSEFVEGNILDSDIEEIWQNSFSKYRNALLKSEDPNCRKCRFWAKCRGGCWVMRLGQLHCIKELLK